MPKHCCVPACTSNYASNREGYVSVFKFPADPERNAAWIRNIPRADWQPTGSSVVCAKHFHPSVVSFEEHYTDQNGERKSRKRDKPTLSVDAVPTIFPNLPSRFTKTAPPQRRDPQERRRGVLQHMSEKADAFLESDKINDFKSLEDYKSFLCARECNVWILHCTETLCVFYMLDIEDTPKIPVSIKVQSDFHVSVYLGDYDVGGSALKWLIPNGKLERWSQLENLLTRYRNLVEDKRTKNCSQEIFSNVISSVKDKMQVLRAMLSGGNFEEVADNSILCFLIDNFLMLQEKKRLYSPLLLKIAFVICFISPSCYMALRNQNVLFLPHIKHLKRLATSLNAVYDNDRFFKTLCCRLSPRERYVNLLLDEIYVKPTIEYKAGNLFGYADNHTTTAARTIQTFMITSAFGSMASIVALIPVKNMTGLELSTLTMRAINLVQACSFKVISVIADNNRVNRKMFSVLCGANSVKMKNPLDDTFIHFLFDTVHCLKSIRNLWLNQRDVDKSFVFPAFESVSKNELQICKASFSDLRKLYYQESKSLLKNASKLNFKTVYPSILERQQVGLACNVFHNETIAAVSQSGHSQTAEFLNIVNRWWTVMNIKSYFYAAAKLEADAAPFTSKNDVRLLFLEKFVQWLNQWRSMDIPTGRLSEDTFHSLIHTTTSIKDLIECCLDLPNVQYILLGKFQTDRLERRFSSYRQLSGGNYNVSVTQVLEAEKKIKTQQLLGLNSARYKEVKFQNDVLEVAISEICSHKSKSLDDDSRILDVFKDVLVSAAATQAEVDNSYPVIYVSGYVSFKMRSRIDCVNCMKWLESDVSDNMMFQELDRGGLTVPSDIVIFVCWKVFDVMQHLISKDNEPTFLTMKNQRYVLIILTRALLNDSMPELNGFSEHCGLCGTLLIDIVYKLLPYFSNILLKNYCKLQNDNLALGKYDKNTKRKLSKFV